MPARDSSTTPLSQKLGAKPGAGVVASRIESDLSFEAVQETGLVAGLVDNKSCSVDDRWQALRFVDRLEDRP